MLRMVNFKIETRFQSSKVRKVTSFGYTAFPPHVNLSCLIVIKCEFDTAKDILPFRFG